MTMSFLLRESPGDVDTTHDLGFSNAARAKAASKKKQKSTIIGEKLRRPQVGVIVDRPRLIALLDKSVNKFGATLVSGRAGTGKTTLAADFASRSNNAVWYSVEPADSDWIEFTAYFRAAVRGGKQGRKYRTGGPAVHDPTQSQAAEFLATCFREVEGLSKRERMLVILDNIHHLFDASWFSDLFRQLVVLAGANVHLLILCRSRPPIPLWRFRSKQQLNVIDENMLEFTIPETRRLCKTRGLSESLASEAHQLAYGHVSKLIDALDDLTK